MALVLNVPNSPHTSYNVFLDGRNFRITYRWSSRTSRWYIDVFTTQGLPVTIGTALVANVPLINKSSVFAPAGQLFLIPVTDTRLTPTRTNIGLGRDFELTYFTEAELIAQDT